MGIINWLIIALLGFFIVKKFLPTKGVTNITVQEAKEKLTDKNVQFIDVRTPGEYKTNHIKEFRNIPLAQLPNSISKLDQDKETVVICQSGMRSSKAAALLKKQNFDKIYNIKGGMSAWY